MSITRELAKSAVKGAVFGAVVVGLIAATDMTMFIGGSCYTVVEPSPTDGDG